MLNWLKRWEKAFLPWRATWTFHCYTWRRWVWNWLMILMQQRTYDNIDEERNWREGSPLNNIKEKIRVGLFSHFTFYRPVKRFRKQVFQNNITGRIWDLSIPPDQPRWTARWKAPWLLWLNRFSASGDAFAQKIQRGAVTPWGQRDWAWSWLLSHLEYRPKVETTFTNKFVRNFHFPGQSLCRMIQQEGQLQQQQQPRLTLTLIWSGWSMKERRLQLRRNLSRGDPLTSLRLSTVTLAKPRWWIGATNIHVWSPGSLLLPDNKFSTIALCGLWSCFLGPWYSGGPCWQRWHGLVD